MEMNGTCSILLLIVLVVEGNVIRSLLVSATSDSGLDSNLHRLKANFSHLVSEALHKFGGFCRKFDVPYLEVTTALTYAREIAKATAFNPLFENNKGVEKSAMEHLILMVLPSSPDFCSDLNCVVSRVGKILAEIAIEGGFLTTKVSEPILQMHAGNLAGNILWRLSRLPDPDAHVLETLQQTPEQTVTRYAKLVQLLSTNLKNSTMISAFYDESGRLDARTSEILSRALCGSVFLGFNLSLLESIAQTMEQTYGLSKNILTGFLDHSIESLLVPCIIAETITFNMIKQGFTLDEDKVEEVSRDVQKFIMLGITMNRMKLDSTKAFVKYSFAPNHRVVVR